LKNLTTILDLVTIGQNYSTLQKKTKLILFLLPALNRKATIF